MHSLEESPHTTHTHARLHIHKHAEFYVGEAQMVREGEQRAGVREGGRERTGNEKEKQTAEEKET